MITFDDTQLDKDVQALREGDEEELVKRSAKIKSLPYVDLSGMIVSTDALILIDEATSHDADIAGFKLVGDQLHVITINPEMPKTKATIQHLADMNYEVKVYLGSHRSLKKCWDRYDDIRLTSASSGSFIDISEDGLKQIVAQVKSNKDVERLINEAVELEDIKLTSRLMEIVMGSGIATKSSDVHIEPQDEQVRLRYRQDGILEDVAFFDHKIYKKLNSRIKILSGMKISISRDAQDGRFTIDYNGVEIEIRVSTIPGTYGEGIVMRILDPAGISVGLEQLGIEPYLLDILKHEVSKPNGLILNTGPTGSGKTTTLYSLLKYIYDPEIKILTIEDPIEYHLEGIHQTQVDHKRGYDFESGLRAAMRQDPDVILVGEIRDHETALAAMQASQTGHLVLSTLHTNSAAGAVPRLLDLDINHATLSQSLTVVLAQRLVRKLTDSKKEVDPTPEQEKIIRAILKNAEANGKDLSRFKVSSDMDFKLYEPVAGEMSDTGYKGRIGIFEAVLIDNTIKDILDQKPNDRHVRKVSQSQNILTMAEDACIKMIQGVTSYEEIIHKVDLEEDVEDQLGITSSKNKKGAGDAKLSPPELDVASQVKENLEAENKKNISDNVSVGDTPLAAKEISLLLDYLRMLENHQREYPDVGIREKVEEVEHTIISLLKSNPSSELFLQRDNERIVKREIDLLMKDLADLKAHQATNPDIGVADQIKKIRTTIEELRA